MRAVQGLPDVAVTLAGRTLAGQAAAALVSVRVQQRLSLPTQCELVLAGPLPGSALDAGDLLDAGLRPGSPLHVGVAGTPVPLFSGEVTAVELAYGPGGEQAVRVRGYDLLHRLRKRQPVRAHVQVSLADLARELTADLDIEVHAAASGPRWPHLLQTDRSDLDLLVDLARQAGLFLTLRERALHILTLEGLDAPLPLRLGHELLAADIEINADPACRTVAAAGWQVHDTAHHVEQVSAPRVGRQVPAAAPPADVAADGARTLVDVAAPTGAHAAAAAQAELDRRVAREVVLRGTAEGDPRLRPGARVQVQGVARAVAGVHVLTEVTHRLDAGQGFVSELCTEPPPPRPQPSTPATLGVVTGVDADLGRVRARLPAFGDLETDWMQVAMAAAGPDKGLMLLPDLDDRVLVLLCRDDPAQGVVLGGLYGADGLPEVADLGAPAARRPFALRTPGGHLIQLDDGGDAVLVRDRAGSFVKLLPDRVLIHAEADLTIQAPGKAIVIRGNKIDFQKG